MGETRTLGFHPGNCGADATRHVVTRSLSFGSRPAVSAADAQRPGELLCEHLGLLPSPGRSRSVLVCFGFGLLVRRRAAPGRLRRRPPLQPPATHPLRRSAAPADAPDDCVAKPGKPPPKPLQREYTGLAAKARCDREINTIMGGVTHFLGVKCNVRSRAAPS
jgi:hypothetical protein